MGNSLCCRHRRSREDEDLYAALGVVRTASREEIDAAFTRLRQAHGPASSGDHKLFDLVKKAFEVLSDPQRRAQYDQALDRDTRTAVTTATMATMARTVVEESEGFDLDDGFQAVKTSVGLWSELPLMMSRIPSDEIKILLSISSGAFGNTWRGQFSGSYVVIKQLKEQDQTPTKAVTFAQEIVRMTQINHPKITAFLGVEWTKHWKMRAVVECVKRGDLRTWLSRPDAAELDWADFKCQVVMDIVDALEYLQAAASTGAMMDSFTSRNVLVDDEEGHCKLSVFAAARGRLNVQSNPSHMEWVAPEIILEAANVDPSKSAIYSLGVLLCELDTLKPPFFDAFNPNGSPMSSAKIAQQVAMGKLRPSVSDECPEGIALMASECLAYDPQARPTAASVAYRLRDVLKNEL